MKPYATAFRLKLNLNRVKDEEMRKKIEWDIEQTKWFGVIYLLPSCKEIPAIENLGFRFRKSGKYYALPEH